MSEKKSQFYIMRLDVFHEEYDNNSDTLEGAIEQAKQTSVGGGERYIVLEKKAIVTPVTEALVEET